MVTRASPRTIKRDAKLLRDAEEQDPGRREFIARLRRSFDAFGSLTPCMRAALIAGSSAQA
jgi:hypothetical protein